MRPTCHSAATASRTGDGRDLPTSPRAIAAATITAMLVCSVPFWTGPWLGMIDYPNHLGRYFILAHYEELPTLQEFYGVR